MLMYTTADYKIGTIFLGGAFVISIQKFCLYFFTDEFHF